MPVQTNKFKCLCKNSNLMSPVSVVQKSGRTNYRRGQIKKQRSIDSVLFSCWSILFHTRVEELATMSYFMHLRINKACDHNFPTFYWLGGGGNWKRAGTRGGGLGTAANPRSGASDFHLHIPVCPQITIENQLKKGGKRRDLFFIVTAACSHAAIYTKVFRVPTCIGNISSDQKTGA